MGKTEQKNGEYKKNEGSVGKHEVRKKEKPGCLGKCNLQGENAAVA